MRDADRRRSKRALSVVEPIICVIVALAIWEALVRGGVIYRGSLATPTDIARALWSDSHDKFLWTSVWMTMKAWGIGMGIVVATAIPLGAALGLSRFVARSTSLTLEFFRAIPSIAALPVLVLLYGIGLKLTVVLIILGALWPLLIQTMYGVQDVDPVARDTARVYGVGTFRRFRLIVAPTAAPYVATGLRLSGVIAMILAIAATLLIGGQGLGAAIAEAQQTGRIPIMFDRIFVAGLLGVLITVVLGSIEARFLRWHTANRETTT
jgi:NitT/TauT family transport system permease protein